MCSLCMVTRTKSTYPNTRKNVAGAVKFFSIGEYYCYNYKIPLCIDVFFFVILMFALQCKNRSFLL